jgi:hypothetical protein
VSLGGNYQGWNTPFNFDQAEDGLLAFPHRTFPFVDTKISSTTAEEEKGTEADSPVLTSTEEATRAPEEASPQSVA